MFSIHLRFYYYFRVEQNPEEELLPPKNVTFEVRVETDLKTVYKFLQKNLQLYKDEKKGPTILAVQSAMLIKDLQRNIPSFLDFPLVQIHVQVSIHNRTYFTGS